MKILLGELIQASRVVNKFFNKQMEFKFMNAAKTMDTIDISFIRIFRLGKYKNNELSLKEKLRYCWNVIKTGRPFEDEILLRQETAKELANHLLEFANKKFEEKK
jgi:hypothetical protein